MQETGLSVVLCGLFAIAAFVSFVLSVGSVRKAHREARKAQQALDELVIVNDTLDVLRTMLKRTEGRIVKAAARSKTASDPDAAPDPKIDPEGWKQWQNRNLAMRKAFQ